MPDAERLISQLGSLNFLERRRAGDALAAMGPEAVAPLCSALRQGEPQNREAAADVLGRLRDPRAVADLETALADAKDSVRRSAARALGWSADPQAIPALRQALEE